MLKKDLLKNKVVFLKENISDFSNYQITNVLLKKYLLVNIEAKIELLAETREFNVNGIINYEVLAIDSRSGEEITHRNQINWNEDYFLDDFTSNNIDLDLLISEQINANIPINLTHNYGTINKVGSGWELLSEDEFEHQKTQNSDPRWDKLKDFKKN